MTFIIAHKTVYLILLAVSCLLWFFEEPPFDFPNGEINFLLYYTFFFLINFLNYVFILKKKVGVYVYSCEKILSMGRGMAAFSIVFTFPTIMFSPVFLSFWQPLHYLIKNEYISGWWFFIFGLAVLWLEGYFIKTWYRHFSHLELELSKWLNRKIW